MDFTRAEIQLFGTFQVTRQGRRLDRTPPNAEWRLLAVLCLAGDCTVPRYLLRLMFWGKENAATRLRQTLKALKGLLPEELGSIPEGADGRDSPAQFIPANVRIDVQELDRALAERRPILAGNLMKGVLCAWLDAELHPVGKVWLDWERTRREMQLAALNGNADALHAAWDGYARRREKARLSDEERNALQKAGVPEARDRAWMDGLMPLVEDPSSPAAAPFLPSVSGGDRFSYAPTPLVGREREVAMVIEALGSYPVVTVSGTGGVGKSRLVMAVAERCYSRFAGQVYWVSLAELRDLDAIYGRLAVQLGVSASGNTRDQIRRFLAGRTVLLILDNLEHLGGLGQQLVYSLSDTGSTRLLVTSRCPVDHPFESVHSLAPLSVPEPDLEADRDLGLNPSVRLFLDQGRLVRPDLVITPRNAAAIAEICRRLEGLPLAIELAAARCRLLTPGQILEQLGQRFDLLSTEDPGMEPRQRALWSALDWSYRLLSPAERTCFSQLGVFRGGWTLESVEAVCGHGEAADLLRRLVEHNLVYRCPRGSAEATAEPRYDMLETIREFALCHLAAPEAAEARGRHLDWFVRLAERSESELRGSGQVDWLSRMDRELDNFRSALDWVEHMWKEGAPERDSGPLLEAGRRLVVELELYWQIRGLLREAHQRSRAALQQLLSGEDSRLSVRVHLSAANFSYQVAEGDSTRLCDQALAMALRMGELDLIARALNARGHLGRTPESCRFFLEPAARLFTALGDREGWSDSLHALGVMAIREERFARADQLLGESLAHYQERGNRRGLAKVLKSLGDLRHMQSDYSGAQEYYRRALVALRDIGDLQRANNVLENLAIASSQLGRWEYSAALFGGAEALREPTGAPIPRHRLHYLEATYRTCKSLGEHDYVDHWNLGYGMSPAEIFDLSQEEPDWTTLLRPQKERIYSEVDSYPDFEARIRSLGMPECRAETGQL